MTTPHPTPEERVEAALNDWRKDAGDLRVHFARAIREAEAAGEARGRAMERERVGYALFLKWEIEGAGFPEKAWVEPRYDCWEQDRPMNDFGLSKATFVDEADWLLSLMEHRARTDKESSDD